MSLNNIAFDHIKDTFYYGNFGEFRIVVDKTTGYFNATKLCSQGNKVYSKWIRLEKTKNLIEFLKTHYFSSQHPFKDVGSSHVYHPFMDTKILYEIKQDNNNEINKQISGTYVCKELILDLASWISPEFYFKCNRIIIEHFEKEYQKTIREKDDKIDELIKINKEIFKQNEETLKKNDELIKKLQEE